MILIASYDILNTAYLESIKNAPSKRYCENRLQLKVNCGIWIEAVKDILFLIDNQIKKKLKLNIVNFSVLCNANGELPQYQGPPNHQLSFEGNANRYPPDQEYPSYGGNLNRYPPYQGHPPQQGNPNRYPPLRRPTYRGPGLCYDLGLDCSEVNYKK